MVQRSTLTFTDDLMMNSNNISAERGFASTLTQNIRNILDLGLRPPAVRQHDRSWVEMQAPDYIQSILEKKLTMPGRLTAGSLIHFGFTPRTPLALQVATGHNGMIKRRNADVIHLQTSTDRLDALGIPHFFIDRHLLSPTATIALDHRTLKIDGKFLASRDFRQGRNAEYGAGILTLGPVPPTGIEALICADDETRDRIAALVSETKLTARVITDPAAYFWSK